MRNVLVLSVIFGLLNLSSAVLGYDIEESVSDPTRSVISGNRCVCSCAASYP